MRISDWSSDVCSSDLAYLNKRLEIDAEGAPPFEYEVEAGEIKTYETDTYAFDDLRLGDGTRLDAVFSALPTIKQAIEKGDYPMKVVGKPAFYEPLSVANDKAIGRASVGERGWQYV